MVSFLNLSQRKLKKLQRIFSVFSIFSLIFQISSGIFLYQPVYSQGATPTPEPTVTAEPTPIPTETPAITSSPEPEITPKVSPTPNVSPTPEITVKPSVTPELTNSPQPSEAPKPETTSPANQPQAPPEETASSTPQVNGDQTQATTSPEPTTTPEPKENGHLAAIILEDTKAASIDKLDLDFQTEGSAKIVTDKLDYAPTDTVLITGTGFMPNKGYTLIITSQDLPSVNFETKVTADDKGNLFYSYQLDGTYRPNYKAEIKDGDRIVAATTFTDADTSVNGGSGSIWTTDGSCGTDQQDINHYPKGHHVYINGSGFNPNTSYDWNIEGKPEGASCDPNQIVASGSRQTDINGGFCFDAYTVANNDCGEYGVDFENKKDNYQVDPDQQLCGNGILDSGEQCDFGQNNGSTTSCSTSCTWNNATSSCPNQSQIQTFSQKIDIDGNNGDPFNRNGWRPANGNPSDSTYGGWDGHEWVGMVVGPGSDECISPTSATAGFTIGQTGKYITSLSIRALDGISGTDGFDVLVNGNFLAHYKDNGQGGEIWGTQIFPVPGPSGNGLEGPVMVTLKSTDPAWGGCNGWGQVTVNWAEVSGYDCTRPYCGDGIVNQSSEKCDYGQANNGQEGFLCNSSCELIEQSGICEVGEPTNDGLVDSIDLGNSDSEIAHNASGWGADPGTGNYGGRDGTPVPAFGLIVGNTECGGSEVERDASFVIHAGNKYVNKLKIRALDGLSNFDDYDVYVNGVLTAHYTDVLDSTELWNTIEVAVPNLTGDINVRLHATNTIWSGCQTWGQIAVNWVEALGYECKWCGEISGRKINADTEEGVEDWPIYLLEKIDTVNVLPNGNSYPSSVSLNNSEDYYVEVSGTYTYITPGAGGSSGQADAEYSDRPDWSYGPGWKKGEDVFPPVWTNALDVLISGSNIDWGEYNPTHRYSTIYTGSGSPANFSIWDSGYGDNSGSLTVNIYRIISKTPTDEEGGYEFGRICEVVNDGIYVAEGSRPGWIQVAPEGGVYQVNRQETYNFENDPLNKKITGVKFNDLNGDGIKDEGESGLSDWTIFVGQKAWESDVQALNTPEVTSPVLNSGIAYAIRVSNTYDAGDGITADAKYSKRAPNTGWTDYVQHYESYGPTLLDLQIDGTSPNWGAYNASHVYWQMVTGSGAALKFQISDFYPSNDTGALHVEIYKVITQTLTDDSGNYTFSLPNISGNVIIGEVTQNGYTQTYPMPDGYWTITQGSNATGKDFGNAPATTYGRVTFEKVVSQGDASPNSWSFAIDGIDGSFITGQDAVIPVGTYRVRESSENDLTYQAESVAGLCSDLNTEDRSATLTVTEDGGTCTFINTKLGQITAHKFEDNNQDGLENGNDRGLAGWEMGVYEGFDCGGQMIGEGTEDTDQNGNAVFPNLVPGEYSVREENLTEGWTNTTDLCQNVDLTLGEEKIIKFGNFRLGMIQGKKYEDLNDNSKYNAGEPYLDQWTIRVYKAAEEGWNKVDELITGHTGITGQYRADGLSLGTYYLCEVLPSGWIQTDPRGKEGFANQSRATDEAPRCRKAIINHSGDRDNTGKNFGNLHYGSISGLKYEDINVNGSREENEGGLSEWTIQLKDIEGTILRTTTTATESGTYTFENVISGTYQVCEESQKGWQRTQPTDSDCQTVVVNPGQETTDMNFGNFKLGEVSGWKWDDYNGNGFWDEGEPALSGWEICLSPSEEPTFRFTEQDNGNCVQTNDNGYFEFTGLRAGNYRLTETAQPGWDQTWPVDPNYYDLTINSGSSYGGEECNGQPRGGEFVTNLVRQPFCTNFGNELQPITLTLSKINNILGSMGPGGTVTYTLTVTNTSKIIARDVSVRDTLPIGFGYVASSTTGASEPTVTGQNIVWSLGNLNPDAIVTITYQAKTDSSLQEGKYPNVALAWGNNRVLNAADNYKTYTDPAWSWVNLIPGVSLSAGIGGTIQQVLGASTETGKVLGAATGAETGWLILAILMIFLGLALKNLGKLRKLIKMMILVAPLLFGLTYAKPAQAANLTVQITTLPEYKNTPVFKLSYTALQTKGEPIQAQFYYHKEGGPELAFGSLLNGETGSIETTTAIVNEQGKYYFKVAATGGGESASSETSTTVDWNNPKTPTNYRKDRAGANAFKIFWKNPDSSDFYKVFIYRSDKRDFTADNGTKIGERGGVPNEDINYLDNSIPWSGETYYALRAIDKAGNASDLVGDGGSITYVEVSPSPGTQSAGETQPLPVAGGVAGGEVLGQGTEGSPAAGAEPQAGTQPSSGTNTGATNGILGGGSKLIWVLGGLGLLALAFYFFSRRSS
ncbi:MAG: hypothetical protein M1575_00550 [Patescibacteria group bacterium]|nr:hypothetical protein [Patescibacteria group bacterium]